MKKINYFYCLISCLLMVSACTDDETEGIFPQPEGITYGTVTDKAGNVYKTLTVGRQTWLAENFRYCLTDGNASEQVTYGELYGENYRAILNGTDKAAYQRFCQNYSGQKFLLYLREQLFAAKDAGRLNISSSYDAVWIAQQVSSYSIPVLLSYQMHVGFEDELMAIWNDAIDHYFQVDRDYLERFGYLYSYEGALRAVKEGAPEGFHLPTDAEWMTLERQLGMPVEELEGLENWRGNTGELLKTGEQGIGFNALYAGAAIYALSTAYNSRYVYKNEGAYFWSSDRVFVSDSLSNGIVRNISLYHSGIRRMTSRLITSSSSVRPSYSVRLVKLEK